MPAQSPAPFLIRPDGASQLIERFEALTAFSQAKWSPVESRRRCRAFPHYTLDANYQLWGDEYAALAPVRAGNNVLLPIRMHAAPAADGQSRLDALFNKDAPSAVRIYALGVGQEAVVEALCDQFGNVSGLPAWAHTAIPVIEARLSGDSFEVEQRTLNTHLVQLAFTSTSVDEGDRYDGPLLAGLPVLPTPTDGTQSLRDGSEALRTSVQLSFDSWGAGHLELREFLFSRGQVSGRFVALNRTDVIALRSFLRVLHGRYQAFWWSHPTTGAMARWRLASDSVELAYSNPSTAAASLSFVELEE